MNAIEHDDALAAELAEYRSPQPLAVLTLIFGLLSFLAVFRTLFWVVPLVAFLLGATALWLLSTDPGKVGRKAAIWGMALALFFGAWGPGRYFSRQYWLTGQARVFADAWLELVQQKKLREAHQLHGRQEQRATEGVTLDEFYRADKYAQGDFNTFFRTEPLKSFSALADRGQVEFDQIAAYETDPNYDSIAVRYRVTVDRDGRQYTQPIQLVMRREPLYGTPDFQWFVESVQGAE